MTAHRLTSTRDPRLVLTQHGADILRRLAAGERAAEMAQLLGTQADTIYEHLEGLRTRFGARTNPELVRMAIHHGFIGSAGCT